MGVLYLLFLLKTRVILLTNGDCVIKPIGESCALYCYSKLCIYYPGTFYVACVTLALKGQVRVDNSGIPNRA